MKRTYWLIGAAILVLAGALSCSHDAVQPGGHDVSFIGAGSSVNDGSESGTDTPGTDGPSSCKADTSVLILADLGGSVTAGRYSVVIPPGALDKDTTIRVKSLETPGVVKCQLFPHGLVFLKPVRLFMDLHGTDAQPGEDIDVFWFDPDHGQWVDIGGTFDSQTMLLWADLPHFSTYAGGRHGW
jgi:hypothetical protein